ncbi:MAG: type II toxin-antitoxin system PemK/MazF family toxin [Candidatus Hydrogenedentes bacterium]|nr:type II toxin-antitoxin system PemK/MazF family toxin [Candidatus Hydrogenedentota bacterium]
MYEPGDVVVTVFPGADQTKRRPAVVLSTARYNAKRPDIMLGVITSQLHTARTEFDCALHDWKQAGLHQPSAFRSFVITIPARAIIARIGKLSENDWHSVQSCAAKALATHD